MHAALSPGRIGPLETRNRIIKTATFEGMTDEGRVTDALIAHHAGMAAGGVALTTVAYGAVEDRGRTFSRQLLVDRDSEPGLSALASAVHRHGGAVSLQLAHCGGFSKIAAPPQGPSTGWNAYGTAAGKPWIQAMSSEDFPRIIEAFVRAAETAASAGFDAVEIHCGHGYLLSQFLSPILNRRTDDWGGSLENRLRLPTDVIRSVVDAVGDRLAVLSKINLSDGVSGGLQVSDSPMIARAMASAGAHALVTSGGLVQRSAFYLMRGAVPLKQMAAADPSAIQRLALRLFGAVLVRPFPWTPGFFLAPGQAVLDAVDIPVVALGGLDSSATLTQALGQGYSFAAMGRTLLADPDFVQKLADGQSPVSRCNHCNQCVAEMDRRGVRCVLPPLPSIR
jgi:2,4-dienoyl-CoA reductase-like NADH-dependent reductase (Old Yellow Enzyme family)